MKTALISSEEAAMPRETIAAIRADGIEIVCRKCQTEVDLLTVAADADVIWLFGPNLVLTPEALTKLPRCRAIFRSGSGVDALPLAKAAELGVKICNTPESIAESVAEHAVSLLFALIRRIVAFDREVRAGQWCSDNSRTNWHISGRTLGLIGYGRIAQNVERMVSGFNMRVIFHDPFHAASRPLPEVMREADYISLHCPLTPETKHLINAETLHMVKPGALLVNTSRGGVIDETALIDALRNGCLGGVALDVTDPEPPRPDNPLLHMDQVIITPHIAAFSADFDKNFWQCSVNKLKELHKLFATGGEK